MMTETQNDLYFDRMSSAIDDKSQIVNLLTSGNVLDFGAGSGELSNRMFENGHHVTAVDGSSEAVKRIQKSFPNIEAVLASGSELTEIFSPQSFDNIVCSSVLHEVYSYGDCHIAPFDSQSVVSLLKIFHTLLRPNGVLIIRDGVIPDNWDETVHMTLTDEGIKFLSVYTEMAPFVDDDKNSRPQTIAYQQIDENVFKCSYESAMEFMYTYTWGINSIERESQELYGVYTENGYREILSGLGFTGIQSTQYLQDGYKSHLNGKIVLTNEENQEIPWPSSNMLLRASKMDFAD